MDDVLLGLVISDRTKAKKKKMDTVGGKKTKYERRMKSKKARYGPCEGCQLLYETRENEMERRGIYFVEKCAHGHIHFLHRSHGEGGRGSSYFSVGWMKECSFYLCDCFVSLLTWTCLNWRRGSAWSGDKEWGG